ncbi:hypothetical protein [Novosphingobium sp. LASN5T]|jgi:hypothetical protein|uniref:hypothetical protein n=1 Tax=Novosphingobium sp. LASN5T TaxID=2491021 RepID=UPI001CC20855|nr:hypothetical protein [Novosphingobium sp. LASN5T]
MLKALLDTATPRLSPAEWQDVKAALNAVADCPCGQPPLAGSLRDRVGRAVGAITGHVVKPRPRAAADTIPAHLRPVRDFLCESHRTRALAHQHIPALAAQGYSPAQIEAMALLGA